MKLLALLIPIFVAGSAHARCGEILERVRAKVRGTKRAITFEPGELVSVKARTKSRKTYLVAREADEALIPAKAVKLLPGDRACAAPAKAASKPGGWRFGVQAGMLTNASNEGYEDLETDVPDSGNVGTLQDPIVLDVSRGEGYWLRVFAEKRLGESWWMQSGFAYREMTFKYTAKANPTLGAVTLDQLSSSSRDFKRRQLRLDAAFGPRHSFWTSWSFGYGVEAALLYNLGGEEKIDVLVPSGAFFKNTPATVSAGPPTIDYELLGVADLRWRDFSLGFGYGLSGMMTFSLGYLF